MKDIFAFLLAGLMALFLTGCAGTGTKSISQRGWIGGSYVLAKPGTAWVRMADPPGISGDLPKSLPSAQRAAIQITALASNAPAYGAGLRPGDFVLELDHQPITSLQEFRRIVDRSNPGAVLAIKAYRDGRFLEYQVPVGREKYKTGGYFSVVVPTVIHRWDLWPDPGFSLVCLGYEPNPGLRHDLADNSKTQKEVYDANWSAYLVFMELSYGKRVVAQETVAAKQ